MSTRNHRLNQEDEQREKLYPGSEKTELEKLNREDVTYVLLLEDVTIIHISSAGARSDLRK